MRTVFQIFFVIILFGGSNLLCGQNAKWAAIISPKDLDGFVECKYVKMDRHNNVYILGTFENAPVYFSPKDSMVPNGIPGAGIFIAKYDREGKFLWAKKIQHTGSRLYQGFEVDREGNQWICAWSNNQKVTYDGISFNGKYTYVAKFNPDGVAQWISDAGDCDMMSVDLFGNVYVFGMFDDSMTIGGTKLYGPHEGAIYLAKINNSGVQGWAKYAGQSTIGQSTYLTMCTSNSGSIYLTGRTEQFIILGDTVIYGPGKRNMHVTKYFNDGRFAWARLFECSSSPYLHGADTDESGNLYITGYVNDTLWLDQYFLTTKNRYGVNYFVARFDSTGNVKWADYNQGLNGKGVFTEACGGFFVKYKSGSNLVSEKQVFSDTTLPGGNYLLHYNRASHIESIITLKRAETPACVGPERPDVSVAEDGGFGDTVLNGHYLSSLSGADGQYAYILYFDRGTSYTSQGCLYDLSIPEESLSASLFPNPAVSYISLKLEISVSEITATLYDLNGRVIVPTQTISANGTNATMKLPDNAVSGLYLLRVQSEGKQGNFKVFIQR
jgi:hypothetical protein